MDAASERDDEDIPSAVIFGGAQVADLAQSGGPTASKLLYSDDAKHAQQPSVSESLLSLLSFLIAL